ncbi:hypothetical protein JKQ17_14705 [Listeria monocytogenes]|nr:hypothetical protein [Listeria monocytogenes]MCP6864104.1 hypothetical protein [Listeria monocytogenes]MCP6884034.1 hypothetical protein [Listeria monocytogenes]MCP6950816.1 hypothetical protein [Listeria monocytogenes]MCP6989257.1 hypothetical protein [Listeria monocytogenes]
MELISVETICETINGKEYDFDRYDLIDRTALSTKEISVVVSFLPDDTDKITGDIIAYGEWGDLDKSECIEYLNYVKSIRKFGR